MILVAMLAMVCQAHALQTLYTSAFTRILSNARYPSSRFSGWVSLGQRARRTTKLVELELVEGEVRRQLDDRKAVARSTVRTCVLRAS